LCLICIFISCFYFLKIIFILKKIRILRTYLVWLFVFFFEEIKILKMHFKKNVFLDLLKIIFLFIAFLFYSKWGSWFQLKTRFYCFRLLIRLKKYFQRKYFQQFNQTHFHHHIVFLVKIKIKNNQIKPSSLLFFIVKVAH